VAHDHPEMVASVVTLQTPHHGTPIADIALEVVDDPALQDVLDLLLQIVGQAVYDEVGAETSLAAALGEFSEAGVQAFNAAYPDQPGIYYASVAGRSDYHRGGSDCEVANAPAFISAWNDERDPIDPLFSVTEALLDGGLTNPYPNDGLVRARDAKWGEFLGCIPADHMDQIGQLFGDSPGIGNDWDYLDFFVALVSHIRSKGL
jgi:triacylglycerol lipase